jgi:TatD DNase family protein
MIIDTHAHVNFNSFKDDADLVLRRSLANNIWIINAGSQFTTSERAVGIAQKYDKGIYAAIGLHPIHLETGLVKIKEDPEEIQFNTVEEKFDYEKYKELAKSEKVVAIGECGFDYYWKPKAKAKLEQFRQKQKEVFLGQFKLSQELSLPIIIHCRMAHDDLIETLEENCKDSKVGGVIHCFTGDWEMAKKYMDMGFYLGFNGIIFKMNLDSVIKNIPLDKVLVETDCPYLTPPPISGRNEPLYVKYVVERIARLKGLNFSDIADATTKNAKKLFKI